MTSKLIFLSRSDFHKALIDTNKSTTDKWDVVVSYSQDKLQPLLTKYWSEVIGDTSVTVVHSTGHSSYDRATTYKLNLGPPQFEFDKKIVDGGSISMARITWPFTGTAHTKLNTGVDVGEKTLTAEDGFSTTVTTPIHAISSGDDDKQAKFHPSHNVPVEYTNILQTSNHMIEFTDGTTSSYHVILQFASAEDTTWKVNVKNTSSDSAEDLQDSAADIGLELNNQEKVKGFQFTLGEVKNTPNPADYVLTPQAFKFSADKGILSIFIHVKGGDGKGAKEAPQFQLTHDSLIAPMPDGYDASIIISRRLIRDKYMIPQIQDKCKDFLRETDGVLARDGPLSPTVGLKFKNERVWSGFTTGPSIVVVTEGYVTVDWDKYPLILELFDDKSTLQSHYKWTWDNAQVTLHYRYATPRSGWLDWRTTSIQGSMSMNSSPVATVKNKDELEFKISFTDSNQPDASFNDIGPDKLGGSVQFKTFTMGLPDINFFRTQNILAPGQQFITAKDTMCPCDLFILGSVEEQKK
ncbi:uncharacterized protein Aud_000008 [Aspergillus udagawae]|uniref:Uncharacterized protein n=1 Tax=Aspergillus udagawae TaxID=91492 RepID=A0A8E0UX63_9EURO|nr:uncharacterized protein Aud_000008 [Aspergillus udagawae]GIC84194.1 hypothetical protein Aud_000008 [Aspergillus udagawae]